MTIHNVLKRARLKNNKYEVGEIRTYDTRMLVK